MSTCNSCNNIQVTLKNFKAFENLNDDVDAGADDDDDVWKCVCCKLKCVLLRYFRLSVLVSQVRLKAELWPNQLDVLK